MLSSFSFQIYFESLSRKNKLKAGSWYVILRYVIPTKERERTYSYLAWARVNLSPKFDSSRCADCVKLLRGNHVTLWDTELKKRWTKSMHTVLVLKILFDLQRVLSLTVNGFLFVRTLYCPRYSSFVNFICILVYARVYISATILIVCQ